MLVLTGQGSRLDAPAQGVPPDHGRGGHVRPVTKWAQSILHPDSIPEVVRKAVRLARTEKPGAVPHRAGRGHRRSDGRDATPIHPRRFRRPVPDDKIVDRAWELIRERKGPIILAGNGTIRKRASQAAAPLRASRPGSAWSPPSWPRAAWTWTADQCLYTIGLQAGTIPSSRHRAGRPGHHPRLRHGGVPPALWNPRGRQEIVHIDFLPAEIDANYHPEVEVVGDLAHTLWMLNERLLTGGRGPRLDHSHASAARPRQEMKRGLREEHAEDDDRGPDPAPEGALGRAPGAGALDILLSDVGAHKMWIARYYQCHEPNTCLIPNGFCSMGFALPGAIARQSRSRRAAHVLAICGDAGLPDERAGDGDRPPSWHRTSS